MQQYKFILNLFHAFGVERNRPKRKKERKKNIKWHPQMLFFFRYYRIRMGCEWHYDPDDVGTRHDPINSAKATEICEGDLCNEHNSEIEKKLSKYFQEVRSKNKIT